jgi:hypothetical protein
MKKKIVFVGVIGIFLLFVVGGIFAQSAQDAIDIYDAIPDNEYYVTAFFNGGGSRQYTVFSCAEAVSLKDRLFHDNSSISSVSIRGKYRVHIWHDDCNKTYYR